MTENLDPALGFCQFCGAKRIMASQEFCARCGQKLLQASDISLGPAPEPPLAPTAATPLALEPATVQASVPVPASAPVPEPLASSVPEQPPAPGWAPAEGGAASSADASTPPSGDSTTPPTAPAPAAGYTYGQPPAPGSWPGGPIYPGMPPYYPGMAPASRRNPALIPILIGIGLVAVLALAGGFYVVASSKSSENPSAGSSVVAAGSTIDATPTPTDTPTPQPTPTGTPVPTTANLTGQMVAAGGDSISGVGVILCQSMDTGCITSPTMTATSSASGQFEIDGISEGTYYVFYTPPSPVSSWSDEQIIDVNDQSARCLGQAFTSSLPSGCENSILFSDDTTMVLHADTFTVTGSGMSIEVGTVCSPKHGLCLDFDNGKPLSVVVTPGTPATVDVTVRGSA